MGDNGNQNGNYYNGLYGDYRVYIGVILVCFEAPGSKPETPNLQPVPTIDFASAGTDVGRHRRPPMTEECLYGCWERGCIVTPALSLWGYLTEMA